MESHSGHFFYKGNGLKAPCKLFIFFLVRAIMLFYYTKKKWRYHYSLDQFYNNK